MQGLFDQFLKEKRFLKNITPKPAIFLCQSYKAFVRTLGEIDPSSLDKANLNEFVSGINSFLS